MKGEVRLQTWCTPQEREIIKWAVRDLGFKSVSDFIKQAVAEKLARERHKTSLDAIAVTGDYAENHSSSSPKDLEKLLS